jgi:hypothetical protein
MRARVRTARQSRPLECGSLLPPFIRHTAHRQSGRKLPHFQKGDCYVEIADSFVSAVDFFFQYPDTGEISVALVVIHTEPYYEPVGNFKTAVFHGDINQPPRSFIKESAYGYAFGLPFAHDIQQVTECQAGVDDIFDDQNIRSLYRKVQVLGYSNHSRQRLPGRKARDAEEINPGGNLERMGQVCKKKNRTFEHCHKQEIPAGVILRDFFRYFFDALMNLSFCKQDLLQIFNHEFREASELQT